MIDRFPHRDGSGEETASRNDGAENADRGLPFVLHKCAGNALRHRRIACGSVLVAVVLMGCGLSLGFLTLEGSKADTRSSAELTAIMVARSIERSVSQNLDRTKSIADMVAMARPDALVVAGDSRRLTSLMSAFSAVTRQVMSESKYVIGARMALRWPSGDRARIERVLREVTGGRWPFLINQTNNQRAEDLGLARACLC